MEIHVDFRFFEIKYELWALGEYLNAVERQLPILEREETHRTTARLREQGLEHDEAERCIAGQELFDLVDNVYPRFFRGPFLVSLWSIYQSALTEIAIYIRKYDGNEKSTRRVDGDTKFEAACDIFENDLKMPLFTDHKAGERLEMLRDLRNMLAHGNGRISTLRETQKLNIEKWASIGVTVSYTDNLLFTEAFVRDTYSMVDRSLRDLMERVIATRPQRKSPLKALATVPTLSD